MDAHDIFRQLTRGVRFTKKKPVAEKRKLQQKDEELKVKKECVEKVAGIEIENKFDDQTSIRSNKSVDEAEFEFLKEGKEFTTPPKKKKQKLELTPEQKQQQLEEERVKNLRREHRIAVLGKNIPPPISSFEELRSRYKMCESLTKNLSAAYTQPTPVQMQALPIMLQGRPLMACAPTGSGKTIAFLAPIINDLRAPKKDGFRAIILAPTRELAQQIFRECARMSEKTALKVHIGSKIQKAQNNKKYDILISTPNRVRFLLQQQPPLLDLKSIEWFVIDEADRLMADTEQNSFKDQLDEILAACTNPAKKLALFSATYTVPVAKWALRNLKNLARLTIGQQNSATETVDQELLFVGAESGKLLAMRNLVHEGLKPPVLVFVQSKDRAKQLFQELLYDGINVDVIHADRTQQQRDNCVRAFREGHIWVLICTELMSRGIDFKGVNLVINYDFPPSTISYIHRIGRSGRAGRTGRAITFFTQDDTPNLRDIAHIIRNSGGKVPDFLLNMKKTRKSVKKQLQKRAPKREDISTRIKPEGAPGADRQQKLQRNEDVSKKQPKATKTLKANNNSKMKKPKLNVAKKIKNQKN